MTEERLPSKFAFILHADIAGSTGLVQQDEHLAHQRIQDAFRRFGNIITEYHGHVRELRGDALLAEFERASDAATAALAFQLDQTEYNAQLNDKIQPTVRIGIAMGEVVIADNTVTGEGVVLAQRLEQLADPGGVCITGAIHEALPRRMPFDQYDLGEQEIKGFDEPVRVYRVGIKEGTSLPEPTIASERKKAPITHWVIGAVVVVLVCGGVLLAWIQPWKPDFEPASVEKMAFPLPKQPSIAVLPFDNFSGDPKMDHFASGLTEDLTSALSKARGLFVIARNTATKYKGQPVDVKQVAEELGVQYVLEGSVQRTGEKLRITAQLIDALSGNHVWSDRYDREMSDVFALQDEIVKRVFTELHVELAEGDRSRRFLKGTKSFEAWLLGKEGYDEYLKFTRESQIRARELWEAALELSPDNAGWLAGVAFTHWAEGRWGWSTDREESVRLGKEAAERAIELDPEEPLGYQALGNFYFLDNQVERGIELKRKAMEIAPNDFSAVGGLAIRLVDIGREEEAVELFERAIRLSPKPPWWVPYGYGIALHLVGRKEHAAESLEKAVRLRPKLANTHARLAAVYVELGRIDEAKAAAEEVLRLKSNFTVGDFQKRNKFLDPERNQWYKDLLVRSGLPENPPLELPDKPSIAVLPFTNMSNDIDQEYFVDGMTEDLITDLSKLSGLFVIARNSSFTYKAKAVDVKNVARDLGVRYILEGSVRKVADQVRINAQLVDASSGGHLWAQRYDGVIGDVFSLQDEITTKIIAALAVQLTSDEESAQSTKQTDSPEAYEAFLKGLEHYRRDTIEHYAKAMEYFEQATDLDPEYSRAYAAMASIYWRSFIDEFYQVFQIDRTTAREKAQQLLELAKHRPTSLTYQASSDINLWWHRYDEAVRDGENAIDLDPNNAGGLVVLAKALIFSGQPQGALDLMDKAEHIDPIGKANYEFVRGLAHFGMDRFDQAAAALERARELNPKDWAATDPENECRPCHMLLSTYGHLGRTEKAQLVFAYIKSYWELFNIEDMPQYWPYKEEIDAQRFNEGLRKAGVPEFGGQ